jgi:outer membrane murein-binding lipoprotein Lpp
MLMVLPLAALMACGPSKEEFEKALADAQALSAEKDSLISEVLETSKFVNGINEELARARTALVSPAPAGDGLTPVERDRASRAQALDRVQALVTRLNETEQRLEQSTQRARTMSGKNATLLKQIEEYKASIDSLQATASRTEAELRAVVDSQSVQIASLTQDLDTTRAAKEVLTTERAALQDTVGQLTTYKNTVYYVMGSEDDLIAKGIAVKEGKKFLFFGGKALQPARNLDPADFTPIDKTHDLAIALPDGSAFRVISRQDLAFADSSTIKDGKVSGSLHVTSPEEFWSGSKYLIRINERK